jgi:hypothetical protein
VHKNKRAGMQAGRQAEHQARKVRQAKRQQEEIGFGSNRI